MGERERKSERQKNAESTSKEYFSGVQVSRVSWAHPPLDDVTIQDEGGDTLMIPPKPAHDINQTINLHIRIF